MTAVVTPGTRDVKAGTSDPIHITGSDVSLSQLSSSSSSITAVPAKVATDSFGRLRVSNPLTLFDSQQTYNESPLFWEAVVVGGGTVVHNLTQGLSDLSVTAANGDSAIRQSRQYFRYQPGKSQLIFLTAALATAQANTRQRVGYFDASNGMFFELTAAGLSVVVRSSVSGVVVDTPTLQNQWNVDTLNGAGPSGYTLDITKTQIFMIDFEALYVGTVRFGFVINGELVIVHEVYHANVIAVPYIRTANLPIRVEIVNTGAAAGAKTLKQVCTVVISEGGFESERGIPHTANNGITAVSVSTRRSILTIRPKATFNTLVNRGLIAPESYDILALTEHVLVELVYGGALGGVPVWTSAGANSLVEYDVAGTTVTGGEILYSGYLASGVAGAKGAQHNSSFLSKLPLSLDIAGANPKNLSLVLTAVSGTAPCRGALNWRELY